MLLRQARQAQQESQQASNAHAAPQTQVCSAQPSLKPQLPLRAEYGKLTTQALHAHNAQHSLNAHHLARKLPYAQQSHSAHLAQRSLNARLSIHRLLGEPQVDDGDQRRRTS
ncbi:Protein of unknown function [Gryllus bimaculatus]|nr:Protein of unknown function [Gryllus bimaculatus]